MENLKNNILTQDLNKFILLFLLILSSCNNYKKIIISNDNDIIKSTISSVKLKQCDRLEIINKKLENELLKMTEKVSNLNLKCPPFILVKFNSDSTLRIKMRNQVNYIDRKLGKTIIKFSFYGFIEMNKLNILVQNCNTYDSLNNLQDCNYLYSNYLKKISNDSFTYIYYNPKDSLSLYENDFWEFENTYKIKGRNLEKLDEIFREKPIYH